MRTMKTDAAWCWLTALALLILAGCSKQERPPVVEDEPAEFTTVADLFLPFPSNEQDIAYLDVPDAAEFAMVDLPCRGLLVYLFNVECELCQKQVKEVNRLYELVEQSEIKDQVKLIGIGKRNDDNQIAEYKTDYNVQFPLFHDMDEVKAGLLGVYRTPNFVVLDLEAETMVHQQWQIKSAEELLTKLQIAAGGE